MRIQAGLNRIWYGRSSPPAWLRPFAALFGLLIELRRLAYRRGWRRTASLAVPVVVVGNLTVGGTGKTPLVMWLARRLAERGFRPGIVTRGFGGSAARPRLLGPADEAAHVGDEPLLMIRRTRLPVAIGADRPAAAQILIDSGCNLIISDDGLQHLALPRACEIAVIDGLRRFGNGALLPAGPLREAPARLAGVQAVVINGEAGWYAGKAFRMALTGENAMALGGGVVKPLAAFCGTTVHAVAGIGNPERFFSMLRQRGIQVIAHARDDHAPIGSGELEFGDDRAVLMTEKDAVKCTSFGSGQRWSVPVDVEMAEGDGEALLEVVMDAIKKFRG